RAVRRRNLRAGGGPLDDPLGVGRGERDGLVAGLGPAVLLGPVHADEVLGVDLPAADDLLLRVEDARGDGSVGTPPSPRAPVAAGRDIAGLAVVTHLPLAVVLGVPLLPLRVLLRGADGVGRRAPLTVLLG